MAPAARDEAAALPGITVVETATADDTSPGAAILRTRDGETTRVAVGGRAEGVATLERVSDGDATFTVDGRNVTLPVIALPPIAAEPLSPAAQPYVAPRVVNPGIAHQ